MSERKAKNQRRKRIQFLRKMFNFTQEEFGELERSDPTMRRILAMNDRDYSKFLYRCAKEVAARRTASPEISPAIEEVR